MKPAPDNIFLLTDSLPTMGTESPGANGFPEKNVSVYFNEAIEALPARVPVNIILYPMEGDPVAAVAFWRLAKNTRGLFLPLEGLAVKPCWILCKFSFIPTLNQAIQ